MLTNAIRRAVQELQGEELGEASDMLRNITAGYVEDMRELENSQRALSKLKDKLAKLNPSEWPDIEEEYKKVKAAQLKDKTSKDDADHPWMKQLSNIFENKDSDQLDSGDDELAMTQAEVNTICPISRTEMSRPVRNTACGHVYDRQSIEALLAQSQKNHRQTYCPVVGCPNQQAVRRDQLKDDQATKKAIAKKRKK